MEQILKISNLSKHFGGVKAIEKFNLSISPGYIYGLIGPNGAGKTTIFNVITGIYEPTEGEVIFQGQSLLRKKSHEIAQAGIARTFQNIRLFSHLNALDNVVIASNQDAKYNMIDSFLRLPQFRRSENMIRDKAMHLLESVGLQNYAYDISGSLPYGHQRKLEIARALALNPTLLLLDEPAAGINADEALELCEFIRKIKEKFSLTILMIEHHMDVVTMLCDRCTVLNFGVNIAEGTAREIKCNPQVIEAYLGKEGQDAITCE